MTIAAGRPPAGVNGQRVRDYPQVSIRVPPEMRRQLTTLSKETGMSRLEIFMEAISCLLLIRLLQVDAICCGQLLIGN